MLSKERIKEAQANIPGYLGQGLLNKLKNPDEAVRKVLINNCEESMKVADLLFKNNYSDLWAIVCSYYAMYYMANAVLYSFGYKVGEKIAHKVTADALIVYIRDKLKESLLAEYESAKEEALEIVGLRADEFIESFDLERAKRNRIQYRMTEQAKHAKAETSLKRAKSFIFEMEKLLAEL